MLRVCLIHWNQSEAAVRISELKSLGIAAVHVGRGEVTIGRCVASQPQAFLIDLSRLPSHGKEAAIHLRNSSSARNIPLIFLGGAPEKVDGIRQLLPDAVYVPWDTVSAALSSALQSPSEPTARPLPVMNRFAHRTAAEKLGIGPASQVAVLNAPVNYLSVLGTLPESVAFSEDETRDCHLTLWFLRDVAQLHEALPHLRRVAKRMRLWLIWPKARKTERRELSEKVVREAALAIGLVDYKICSVDATWSGMLFAIASTK